MESGAPQPDPKIYKICLTGGPMGGKTSSIKNLAERFSATGMKVFTVPEIATQTINNGFLFYEHQTFDLKARFNYRITKMQYDIEDYHSICAEILRESQNHSVLVIYDRGILDNWPYITMEVKNHIYEKYTWSDHSLLEGRYNGVFHLVTVADMDLDSYTDGNDQFGRIEAPLESILLDKKNQHWYLLEENFWVIDNPKKIEKKEEGFARKMDNLYGTVCQVLGLDHGLTYPGSKFLGFKKAVVLSGEEPDWGSIGLEPLTDPEQLKDLVVMGNRHEKCTYSNYLDFEEEVFVMEIADTDDKNESAKWIMKRTDHQNNVMYYLVERKYYYSTKAENSENNWPLGFWDKKTWLSYDDWYKKLEEIFTTNSQPTNFIKNVRKFVWGNRIYKIELFGSKDGQMTKTLVSDFDAPMPDFLKTD